jgi:hypothetical protein
MAHPQQVRFVNFLAQNLKGYFSNAKVLEIGSLDINGSVRRFFTQCNYTGIDVGPGEGVDFVEKGEDFSARANSYKTIISCECMEHNPEFDKTWLNMVRLLTRDGLMIMTCATYGRAQHGTSENNPADSPLTIGNGQNYYRNLIRKDFDLINYIHFFHDYFFVTDYSCSDLYFAGIGIEAQEQQKLIFSELKRECEAFYGRIASDGTT